MVHRALLGSLERFFGVLIEHYARRLPALARAGAGGGASRWRRSTRTTRARSATSSAALGVRVHVDDRNEKLGYRIREAQVQKVPYMLVVGDKEVEAKTASVRHRHAGDLGAQDVSAFGATRRAARTRERAVREEDKAPSGGGVS